MAIFNSTQSSNQVTAGVAKERPRRVRVLKKAHAAFNTEFSAVPCAVRNTSDEGALVEFVDPVLVPEKFVLHIEIDGQKVLVERRWQKGQFVGVRYLGEKVHTEVGRDQVVQPSENRLVSAQEREAEVRRKLDEARHKALLAQQQAEAEAQAIEEAAEAGDAIGSNEPVSADPADNSPIASAPQNDAAIQTETSAPVAQTPPTQTSQPVQSFANLPPEEAPLTGRIELEDRTTLPDRRDQPRPTFGRRVKDQ